MISRMYLIFCLCLSFVVPTFGATSLLVTDIGTSAEMLAIGQIEGFSKSSNAVFGNPSNLSYINHYSLSLFTTQLFSEVTYRNISVAKRNGNSVFALGYMSAGVDNLVSTKMVLNEIVSVGHFSVQHSLTKFGYYYDFNSPLQAGFTLNYYFNDIHTVSSKGINSDLGLAYRFKKSDTSLVLKNIFTFSKMNYSNSGTETLPLNCLLSTNYKFDTVTLFSQLKSQSGSSFLLKSLGFDYKPSFLSFITFRSGYKDYISLGEVNQHYTVGVGLTLFKLNLDYAYEKSDHLQFDNHNYFSLNLEF